jgi:TPR repeat protein
MPLLARWTAAERDALEGAMRTGIAIVRADDCRGMRLLPECHARGHYGYLGQTPEAYPIDLSSDEELRVNAPRGGAAGETGGGPLRVDVAIVGRRATTRGLLSPEELIGDCAGATHYVQEARIGAAAIALERTTAGRAASDACKTAGPESAEAPASCKTIVEIRINPIAELGQLVTFDRAPSRAVLPIGACPTDMVVAGQRCVRPPVDGPYLCAFGDAAGCREQCDRGDVNSCDVLGFMQWHGKGVPKEMGQAAATYATACDRGDSIACANFGAFLHDGEGVPKDPARSAALVERGCRLGAVDACATLAIMLLRGDGVAPDEARGANLLQRACDAGSEAGCREVVRRLRGGPGATDPARAVALLDALCDENNGSACLALGRLRYLGEGVPSDRALAATLFAHACRVGQDDACVMLGLQYRQADGVERDDVLATRLMGQACDNGLVDGCLNLGIAYENGKGTRRDPKRAAELYEQACHERNATACLYLADLVRDGVGVEPDAKRARDLYAQACELGEQKACR